MLRSQTHHQSLKTLSAANNHQSNLSERFSHSVLNVLQKFWQFSCFYGDYIAQPLEQRQKSSI